MEKQLKKGVKPHACHQPRQIYSPRLFAVTVDSHVLPFRLKLSLIFGDVYRKLWVATEEIAYKCVQLWITSTVYLPDLLDNKKLTFMQLLTIAETSKNKVSTIKPEANLHLRK